MRTWFIVEWPHGTEILLETISRVGFVYEMKVAVRRHGGRVLAVVYEKDRRWAIKMDASKRGF